MNALELLESLKIIKTKLDNNEVLTDNEYKLLALMMIAVINGVIINSIELVLNIMKGDNDEKD